MEANIILQIKAKLPELSKAERKVGEYILEHSVETVNSNTSELAENAGVSAATIIRFCHSIGLSGFSQLKIQLYADASGVDKDLYTDIAFDEDVQMIAEKLALRFNQSISQTVNRIDVASVNDVVELIGGCTTIYVYGLGASHIVAEDFMQKFSRIGKPVINMLDHHLMSSSIISRHHDAIFVAISNSGETSEVLNLTSIARQNNVPTIGISQYEGSTLATKVDYPIIHHGGEKVMLRSAATTSLISQLFTVDVLYFTYANKHPDKILDMLKDSKINIQSFFRKE